MSSTGFSNTDTGSKPADPYKAKNLDRDATTKEKVEDLAAFEKNTKFGMMTTRDGKTGNLVSRCMAIAAQVRGLPTLLHPVVVHLLTRDHRKPEA
jgi:hypothetical protein